MVIGMSDGGQDREDIRAHLSMMQSVITRMADNSRACKTWAVTLVAAILVVVARFGTTSGESAFGSEAALIALVPTILFWILDSYYLALERGFRESYDRFVERLHTSKLKNNEVFKIVPTRKIKSQTFACMWRFATVPLYGVVAIVIVVFASIAR